MLQHLSSNYSNCGWSFISHTTDTSCRFSQTQILLIDREDGGMTLVPGTKIPRIMKISPIFARAIILLVLIVVDMWELPCIAMATSDALNWRAFERVHRGYLKKYSVTTYPIHETEFSSTRCHCVVVHSFKLSTAIAPWRHSWLLRIKAVAQFVVVSVFLIGSLPSAKAWSSRFLLARTRREASRCSLLDANLQCGRGTVPDFRCKAYFP